MAMMAGFSILFFMLEVLTSVFTYTNYVNVCPNLWKYARTSSSLLHQHACGDGPFFSRKIMGGSNANLAEFPYMALLLFKVGNEPFCDGSIINKRYILTAAHCFDSVQERLEAGYTDVVARLGEYNIDKNPDCFEGYCAPPVQDFLVEEFIPHEEYNKGLHNDIALFRLNRDIVFNPFISPVCLPFDCELLRDSLLGKTVTVAGWGLLSEVPTVNSIVLQKIQLPITSTWGCSMDWGQRIPQSILCAGGAREYIPGRDACQGDSGGPLLYTSRSRGYKYFQVGIVAAGDNCTKFSNKQLAGLYMRVASFVPWILTHVRE